MLPTLSLRASRTLAGVNRLVLVIGNNSRQTLTRDIAKCYFSNKNNDKRSSSFRPRKRSQKRMQREALAHRQRQHPNPTKINPDFRYNLPEPNDELDEDDPMVYAGPVMGEMIKQEKKKRDNPMSWMDEVEEDMRWADYMGLAQQGSAEELIGDRRIWASMTPEEQVRVKAELDKELEEGMYRELELDEDDKFYKAYKDSKKTGEHLDLGPAEDEDDDDEEDYEVPIEEQDQDFDTSLDPNQQAYGPWSEMLITIDRNNHMWRGGRLETYRALVIGGNLNGCGGYAIGKAKDAQSAVMAASRKCKKRIFFVDRYHNNGLAHDVAGKQNSCKVHIRANNLELKGNPLIREILKRFGITKGTCKAHGRRSPYNVVRATFKALMTHESIEEMAMKRGKRLVSMDKAMRLDV